MRLLQKHLASISVFATGAALAAVGLVSGLMFTTIGDPTKSAMVRGEQRLDELSQRAERLRLLARHVRKAAFTQVPHIELPYAGLINSPAQLVAGSQMSIPAKSGRRIELEVLSTQLITPNLGLTGSVDGGRDLVVVTAEALNGAGSGTGARVVRFLATVKPSTTDTGRPDAGASEERSL